jgi:molybdopterin-guanine dinucleotide biosynthesis protein A
MGQNKALLPYRGIALAEFVARTVAAAAGSAVLVGDPDRHRALGFPVIADRHPGEGPLGGIITALDHSAAEWSLVVACDMPCVSAEFLRSLVNRAEESAADVLLPTGPSGRPEPLCAVYRRRCLPILESAFAAGERKITQALAGLNTLKLAIPDAAPFQNVNTPEDWAAYAQ